MASEAYLAKLRDPRWQKLRLEILERDGWKCRNCGASDKTLHVHHSAYPPWSTDPWEAHAGVLVALCADCHEIDPEAFRASLYTLIRILGEADVRGSADLDTFVCMLDACIGGPHDVTVADALRDALLWYLEERAKMVGAGDKHA